MISSFILRSLVAFVAAGTLFSGCMFAPKPITTPFSIKSYSKNREFLLQGVQASISIQSSKDIAEVRYSDGVITINVDNIEIGNNKDIAIDPKAKIFIITRTGLIVDVNVDGASAYNGTF